MVAKKSFFPLVCLALVALSSVAFLGKSYETSLRGIDSNIHARVSLDVTSRGFLPAIPAPDPQIDFQGEHPRFNDHPFFYFWLNGWIMRALGPSAWSARVLTSAFSVGCVLMTLALGTAIYSELFGVLAALFLVFTRDIILTGATVSLDPALMFFTLLSFYFWQKNRWFWIGISVGIGLWIKSPVVLLVFPTAALIELHRGRLNSGHLKTTVAPMIGSAVLALGLGSVVWLVTGLIGGWDLVSDYWVRQVWGTAAGGRNLGRCIDFWMFFRMVKHGFLPGLPFLFGGIFVLVRDFRRKKKFTEQAALISIAAVGVTFLALLPMKFRLDYYYNPTFPFLCFLSAYSLIGWLTPLKERFYQGVVGFTLILLPVLLCAPISFGPEGFVGLRRFIPLIQTYGSCQTHVGLVPGGEPFGSAHDSRLALGFYTHRNIQIVNCSEVSAYLNKVHPEWLILSAENYLACLSPADRSGFTSRLRVGEQLLLSTLIPQTGEMDLTPLDQELRPVSCPASNPIQK